MDLWITKVASLLFITVASSQQFFNTMPPPVNTNFTCRGRDTGFYADVETNCRVYHTCDENGNKFTYYCPAETAFRQEALVCDHAHLVDCATGRRVSQIAEKPRRRPEVAGPPSFDGKNDGRPSTAKQDEKSSSSAYTRSFKITQERQSQFSTPQNKRQPTFVLSSSVFLRDRANSKRNESVPSRVLPTVDNVKDQPGDGATSEENGDGYSRFPSSSTSPSSPAADFPVKPRTRDPPIFRSTPPYEERTKKIATTGRPESDEMRRFVGTSGTPRNYEKFKLSYPNDGESRAGLGNERSKSTVDLEFDRVPMRDEKLEISARFNVRPTNGEAEFESQGRNQDGARVFAENASKASTFSKNFDGSHESPKDARSSSQGRPIFPHDSSNFPYFETLRSMQALAEKSSSANSSSDQSNSSVVTVSSTTVAPPTTAGTEFPVFPFADTFSPFGPNELDDDPYYPKRSTTTEAYYKLANAHAEREKSSRFSTKRPWPGSLNFEIPEVLPDLNTLDDLVDRRKFFFIPRVNKATLSNRELRN